MGRLDTVIGTEIIKTPTDEIRLGHTWYEVSVLRDFILKVDPIWFIEIGIHEGGLSYSLIPILNHVKYLGVELFCNLIRPEVFEMIKKFGHEVRCIDCFDFDLCCYIEQLPHKIIYCDGGHKAKELIHFQYACNPGDILLSHDFYDGKRKVRGVPDENISKEVLVSDVAELDNSEWFERLDEDIFKETRIVGWKKL